MADRTSATVFAEIFTMLAEDPTPAHRAMAHRLWRKTRRYDFSDDQMGCDKALAKLGLARMGVDRRYPDDGKVWLYGPRKGRDALDAFDARPQPSPAPVEAKACATCNGGGRAPTCLYDSVTVEHGGTLTAPLGMPCPDCAPGDGGKVGR